MYYSLAQGQFINVGQVVVTRSTPVTPGNGLLLCIDVIQFAGIDISPLLVASIQTSNDDVNWDTDLVNLLPMGSIGHFEKRYDSIASSRVRIGIVATPNAAGIVAVGIDTADL